MRLWLAAVLAVVTCPASAVTPESSPAVLEAIRTGEVVGAAEACGVPEARLVETGRKIIYAVRAMAKTPEEVDRARVRHEQAVARGVADVKAGRRGCVAAVRAFDELGSEIPKI